MKITLTLYDNDNKLIKQETVDSTNHTERFDWFFKHSSKDGYKMSMRNESLLIDKILRKPPEEEHFVSRDAG